MCAGKTLDKCGKSGRMPIMVIVDTETRDVQFGLFNLYNFPELK
jgi:hypothetical protein